MHAWNYRQNQEGVVERFPFPNSERRNREAIEATFKEHGIDVADVSWEFPCWTWVLTTTGSLYLHDTSHGCGGVFSLESKAK